MTDPVKYGPYFLHPWSGPDIHGHEVEEVLHEVQSPFQQVLIARLTGFGRALFLDGIFQSCEADEHLYHEALVQPAMVLHPGVRRVLILGGGEGATAREALRSPAVEEVRMAEIDRAVIDACREYMPGLGGGAWDDPRLHLEVRNALEVVDESQDVDVIFHDLTEPEQGGPSSPLFDDAFFKRCRKALADDGMLVIQAGQLRLQLDPLTRQAIDALLARFPHARVYAMDIPSFGADWLFVLASNRPLPEPAPGQALAPWIDQRLRERCIGDLRVYDGISHAGMFHLSRLVRDQLPMPRTDT